MSKKKQNPELGPEVHELVLVVDREVLEDFDGLDGCSITTQPDDLDQISASLRGAFFMSRREAEENPVYKQIIPYLIVSSGDRYLTYRRSGAEKRLTDLFSIGIGGHINPADSAERRMGLIRNNVRREVAEELSLDGAESIWDELSDDFAVVGVLYDDSNDVGRVHLGIVLRIDVRPALAKRLRMGDEGKEMSWKVQEELEGIYNVLEGWSKVCVDALADFVEVHAQ